MSLPATESQQQILDEMRRLGLSALELAMKYRASLNEIKDELEYDISNGEFCLIYARAVLAGDME